MPLFNPFFFMKFLCKYFVLGLIIINSYSTTMFGQETIDTYKDASTSLENTENESHTTKLFARTIFTDINVTNSVKSYTVHYDLILLKGRNFVFSGNIGFGLLDTSPEFSSSERNSLPKNNDFVVPVEANVLFGKGNHHLEIGLGTRLIFGLEEMTESYEQSHPDGSKVYSYQPAQEYTSLWVTSKIGYRFQNLDKGGLFFRASLNPTLETYSLQKTNEFNIGASVSVGFSLNQKKSQIPVLRYD